MEKGFFKPKYPNKYKGDPTQIVYRSSWELKFFLWCDQHPDVLQWSSEEIIIPYLSPIDGRWHRYFPDCWIRARNKAGQIEESLVEIKPYGQTRPPAKQDKINRRYLKEVQTWGINTSKWNAAKKYCQQRDWKFIILTEKKGFEL